MAAHSRKRRRLLRPAAAHDGHTHAYAADSAAFAVALQHTSTSTSTSTEHTRQRRTMAAVNPGMRTSIRASYLDSTRTAAAAATPTENEHALLLLLDLNGTLLFRPNRSASSSHASAHPIHRPYLRSFLLYALGIPSRVEERHARAAHAHHPILHTLTDAPPIDAPYTLASAPTSDHPPRLSLLVWSSAKLDNVHRMVRSMLLPTAPSLPAAVGLPPASDSSVALLTRLTNIWARDTLVPIRSHALYNNKVQCVKDLEIVWYALASHGSRARPPDITAADESEQEGRAGNRLSAETRAKQDRNRPDTGADWIPDTTASQLALAPPFLLGTTPGTGSIAAEAAYLARTANPTWDARNTLLLDDSPLKAALQPYNHLCVPEFGDSDAKRVKRVRERLAARLLGESAPGTVPSDPPAALPTDLSLWNQDIRLLTPAAHPDGHSNANANADAGADLAAVDDVLLQLVGVLEAARRQAHVAAWIYAGGLAGFGRRGSSAPAASTAVDTEKKKKKKKDKQRPDSSRSTESTSSSWASHAPSSGSHGSASASSQASPWRRAATPEEVEPHLRDRPAVPDEPSAAVWAERGRAALRAHGIPLLF